MDKMAYSIRETADALGLAQSTVRTMVETGQLPAVRVGVGKGKFLVPRQALENLLQMQVA